MQKSANPPRGITAVIEAMNQGMGLEKCRRCGCMQLALDAAQKALASSDVSGADAKVLAQQITEFQEQMEPTAYDCLGCKVCWGAEATRQLEDCFGCLDLVSDACTPNVVSPSCSCSGGACHPEWPPYPGEFIVGNPEGSVAVCTLASHDLPSEVVSGSMAIAIAGKCDTENIGVEKVVLNILANENIRWLVLCGTESEGHHSGDTLLKLKEHGVDAAMRVLQATSRRPILKNLTMLDVATFRQQVQIVNLVECTAPTAVLEAVLECAEKPLAPLAIEKPNGHTPSHETITARPPKRLQLDPAGFFVVLLNRPSGLIVCEHYENDGKITYTIEGKEAALIAATAVELGLVSRLDHAAYLGRELTKAEVAIRTGDDYIQDAALGILKPESCSDSSCSCHK